MNAIVNSESRNAAHKTPVVVVVEGYRDNWELPISDSVTVAEFAAMAGHQAGISGDLEVQLENRAAPLVGDQPLLGQLPKEFVVVHVATKGEIDATFNFNGREVHHLFLPSATIRALTNWAVGTEGFGLEGPASDYQLKHAGEILEPDLHLGQVAHGQKSIEFDLVLKIKPQG